MPDSNEMGKSYFSMRGCKITRENLDRIWELASRDFSDKSHVKFETEKSGSGITSDIPGSNIEQLLANVKRSVIGSDPNRIDNINIYISSEFTSDEVTRRTNIWINHSSIKNVYVLIEGEDPLWVIGQIVSLRDLFAATRSKFVMPFGRFRIWLSLLAIGITIALMLPVSRLRGFADNVALKTVGWSATLAVVVSCGYLLGGMD